jgi:plasmid stabilization system protein ParE
MIVSYSRRAKSDLEDILRYLSERSPVGARNVSRSSAAAIEVLADNPEIGVKTRRPGVRVWLAVGYPYKVSYRVRDEAVEILHIRHAARPVWRGM